MTTEPRPHTAFVFPGMAPSQFSDVAKFMMINPHARELLAVADEVLGYSLFARYRDGRSDYSEHAQIAFFLNSLASARWAEERYGRPQVIAGPSFGSKAAAVYSNALDLADAIRLTAELARHEDEYFAAEHRDIVTHSFARTPADRLAEILAELDALGGWYEISCYIDDDFHMLSLEESRVEWLEGRLRAAGGLPLYSMRPPMHCAAFATLRDTVEREVFAGLTFADPELPVVADQDGALLTTGEGVRTMMLEGYVKPVRWPDTVAGLQAAGVGRVVVTGPDKLFGRVPVTTSSFETLAANPRTAMMPEPQRTPAR
ncbi:ACP S-malonyltransferase [Kitasatospora sp. NPDC036755]|uniref:ACP S-malonyltransferase n=1 Tax=Kitasatospora sp. NPDC036755 TaxID=3154600 RepID=UPI0033E56F26